MPSRYNACCRKLIFNVTSYFEEECSNGGPLIPVTRVRQRAANALGIGKVTVAFIMKEKYGASGMEDNEFKDKKRRKKKKGDTTNISQAETQSDNKNDTKVSEIRSNDAFIHNFIPDSTKWQQLQRLKNSVIERLVTNTASDDQAISKLTSEAAEDVPQDGKTMTQNCDLVTDEGSHTNNEEDMSIGVTINLEDITEDEFQNHNTTFATNTQNDNDIFEPMCLVSEDNDNIGISDTQSTLLSLGTNQESHTQIKEETNTDVVTIKHENITEDEYTSFASDTLNENDIFEPMCLVTEDHDIETLDLPQNTSPIATKGNRVVATFKIGRIKENPSLIEDNLKVPASDPNLIIDLNEIKKHVKAYHARKELLTINKLLASLENYGINYGGSKAALLKILDQIGFKFKKSP